MNRWKASFFITFAAFIASNLYWLYFSVDLGISYTYQQDSLKGLERAHEFLGELIVEGSQEYSQKDILHLLRKIQPNAFIVEENNKIIINGVTFVFENNKIHRVH